MYVHLHKHAQVLHEEASNVQGTSASVNQLSSAHYGFSLWIVVDTIWPPYIYICMPMLPCITSGNRRKKWISLFGTLSIKHLSQL